MAKAIRATIAIASFLVLAWTLPACDELEESILCSGISEKICAKWFECWPGVSEIAWGNAGNCENDIYTYCNDSELLLGCELDNSRLRSCDNQINASPCGSLPEPCTDLVACVLQ